MGCEDDPITLADDGSILLYGSDDCSDQSIRSLGADGSVKWSIRAGHVMGGGRSVAKDGTIYIVPDANYPMSDASYLAALDAKDGSVLFNVSLTLNSNCDPLSREGPVLGSDGLIYVNGLQGLTNSSSCVLRAFHRNGTEAWHRPMALSSHLLTKTTFDGKHDTLYIVQPCSSVMALCGASGAMHWQTNISSRCISGAGVVLDDNTIYLWDGGDDSVNSVYAVRDKAQVWQLQTGGTEYPAFHEGTAYIQGWTAGMTSHGLEFHLKLFAVKGDGQVQWTFIPKSDLAVVAV